MLRQRNEMGLNKYDKMVQRNNIARLVRQSNRSGSHRNCIRIAANEGGLHRIAKYKKCEELILMGHQVLVEGIFEDGLGRADILDLDTGTVYEIVSTEKEASLFRKIKKYPEGLTIIIIDPITMKETVIRA